MKKRKKDSDLKENVVFNIQSIIMSVLMAITLVTIVTMGFLLYQRFKLAIDKMAVSNTEATVESTVDRVNSDLLDIRQIFDAANYNIVQEFDISSEKFAEQFSLLYEVNSDKIESLALYGNEGRLIASEPVAVEKENIDVKGQDWYKNAESAIENVHFSIPHIQNLYEDGLYRYHWVVSLSRYVDINDGEIPGSGVLLVDMKYSVIEDVLKQINDSSEGIYYYMISRDGQMIYHPRKTEMARGLFEENSLKASGYEEGTYEITTDGHKESVVVGNIAYTGWKLIGVVPESVQTARINNFRYYIFTTIMVLMMMLLEGNRLISRKISKPIRKLDESVKTYEAGGKTDIYIGGSSEIRHLGYSVQRSYERIETLMEEIIRQQNERRKSELDALQSQINPHFLFNTLNLIAGTAEIEDAATTEKMINTLSRLFRYNLKITDTEICRFFLHFYGAIGLVTDIFPFFSRFYRHKNRISICILLTCNIRRIDSLLQQHVVNGGLGEATLCATQYQEQYPDKQFSKMLHVIYFQFIHRYLLHINPIQNKSSVHNYFRVVFPSQFRHRPALFRHPRYQRPHLLDYRWYCTMNNLP